jgi:mRNA interferase MazF
MVKQYTPKKGDLVWLNFSPQKGKEQRGRRPALVLSSSEYNRFGLMIACPITSQIKGYPFEVLVDGETVEGAILADHVKNLDWKAREAKYIEKVSDDTMFAVQSVIAALMIQ